MRIRVFLLPAVLCVLCILNWSLGTTLLRLLLPLLLLHPAVRTCSLMATVTTVAAIACRVSVSDLDMAVRSVPWVPTPYDDLVHLFAMSEFGKNDTLLELGAGDGRNLVAAAERGKRAVGYEFSPILVWIARLRAQLSGLSNIDVVHGDILEIELPPASHVLLYLSAEVVSQLAPRLQSAYATPTPMRCVGSGVRVLSRDFEIPGWEPLREEWHGRTHLLVYSIPRCIHDI
jgi:hypothetical protein